MAVGGRVRGLWGRRRVTPGREDGPAHSTRPVRPVALLIVLVAAFILGGCSIQVGLATVVHDDGSADVRLRVAADRQILSLLDQQVGRSADQVFADIEEGVPDGWQTDQGTDAAGTRWLTVSRSFANSAEIGQAAADEDGPVRTLGLREISITHADGAFRRTTSFRAVADPGEALARLDLLQRDQAQQLLSTVLQIENRLTLPGRVSETNADRREPGALVWTVSPDRPTAMTASSVAYRWDRVAGIVAVALVLLGGIVLVGFALRRRRHP